MSGGKMNKPESQSLNEIISKIKRTYDALELAVEGLKEVSKRFDGLSPEAKIAKATLAKIESLLGEQGKEAPDEQG